MNKIVQPNKTTIVALAAGMLFCASMSDSQAKKKSEDNNPNSFQREETLVLNLTKAPKSARFFILQALRETKENEKNLDKAIRQVQQADATFAKARRHPDDRTMNASVERLRLALQTAQQLEKQLQEANDELKADVQQTLIAPR